MKKCNLKMDGIIGCKGNRHNTEFMGQNLAWDEESDASVLQRFEHTERIENSRIDRMV